MNHKQHLPEARFLASRRTVLLGYPRYAKVVSDITENFEDATSEELRRATRDPEVAAADVSASAQARAWDAVAYLHLQYSAGESMMIAGEFFPDAAIYWSEYAAYHCAFHETSEAAGRRVPHVDLHDTDYWDAIRLTSFAILLGHTALLPRIAALWDYENDEMDGLLERLVAPFVPGRAPPPDSCTRHLPYFKLLKVFAAEPAARPALMARYMDQWYTASRREPYYESHTKGREHSFLGYWSFEAAAVAYVLDIDDASFRDHEFYPKDMADFARSLPRPAAIGGPAEPASTPSDRLRCLAGQPCPRTGYWFTPAAAGSRRHFDAGHTMPDLASSDGASGWATVWQWDEQQ